MEFSTLAGTERRTAYQHIILQANQSKQAALATSKKNIGGTA